MLNIKNKIYILIFNIILFFEYRFIISKKEQLINTITFFIRPIYEADKKIIQKAKEEKLKHNINSNLLDSILDLKRLSSLNFFEGIYNLYGGEFCQSDHSGKVIFKKFSSSNKIYILVTNKIKPVPIKLKARNLISGFLVDSNSCSYYLLTKNSYSTTDKILIESINSNNYWKVEEIDFNQKKIIPYNTIIILANPEDIFIPIGEYPTILGDNWLLPTIYTLPEKYYYKISLNFLNIRRFFSKISLDIINKGYINQAIVK